MGIIRNAEKHVSIEEARKIVAERTRQNRRNARIHVQQAKLQLEQEEQERLQQEQELKKEQNDIQHKFDINVPEETARFHEYLLQRNLKKEQENSKKEQENSKKEQENSKKEQEKNVWKFRKPDESKKEWLARIKKHNSERAIYLQYTFIAFSKSLGLFL